MDIQLLLAHADDHEPVLPEGIPKGAELNAPLSVPAPHGSERMVSMTAPPDALPEQRWAIVAPKGATGDRLLQLIEPLRRRRSEEQEEEALVYRVDPGMNPSTSAAWIQREYWDAVGRREGPLPRYLLILGGPDVVSWSLQQLLGCESFVGRITFPHDPGYEAYVEKVLRWERAAPAPGANVLFYTVRDGSKATEDGYRHLMSPSLRIARDAKRLGGFPAADIVKTGGPPPTSSRTMLMRCSERSSALGQAYSSP